MDAMKEHMTLVALLSLAVYFWMSGVMVPMQWGDHYLILFIIIKLNAVTMWTLSALVVFFGKELLSNEV